MSRHPLTRFAAKAFRLFEHLYVEIPYRLSRDKRWSFPPTHLFVSPTLRCNIRCEFCFEIEDIEDKAYVDDELTLEQWNEVIDRIPPRTLITFIGGELFMRKDAFELFARSAAKHRITICTNGTMISPEILDRLWTLVPKRPWKAGLLEIGYSLQGGEAVHDDIVRIKGSYQRTVRGLGYLQEAKKKYGNKMLPFTTLRTTMQPKNMNDLVHMYDLAKRFEVDTLDLQVLQDARTVREGWEHFDDAAELTSYEEEMDFDRFREILEDLTTRSDGPMVSFTPADIPVEEVVKIYKRTADLTQYRCVFPWTQHAIHPDGGLSPCLQAVFPDSNIKGTTIGKANQSDLFRNFRHQIATHGLYPTCMGCCGSRYIGPKHKATERSTVAVRHERPEPTEAPTP